MRKDRVRCGAAQAPAPARRAPAVPGGVPVDDTTVVEDPLLGRLASAEGLFVTDERQRIVAWSSAAQRLLGYAPEETIGRPCYLVIMGREPQGHPICRRDCQVVRNARRRRGTAAYSIAARGRDGEIKHLENSVLVLDGERGGFRVLHQLRASSGQGGSVPGRGRRPRAGDNRGADAPLVHTEPLTRRELQVLNLVAAGSTTDDIARQLAISVLTARNHIANVERKLGARNRLEMVLFGMRAGLV